MILIIDFGSQTTHLIARRVRDLKVATEIVLPQDALSSIQKLKPKGIILSGGPSSVYGKNALLVDKKIFFQNIPVLGICYGLQLMAQLLEGKVTPGKKKEYGPTVFTIKKSSLLFKGLYPSYSGLQPEGAAKRIRGVYAGTNQSCFSISGKIKVWMSHFDQVASPPKGASITGATPTVKIASFADEKQKFYGVQFHPEVHHTPDGKRILANFVLEICKETPTVKIINTDNIIVSIKKTIGNNKTICALSGGIDSAVAAFLTYKAIGNNLTCFYVDTGLMREGETDEVKKFFTTKLKLPLKIIEAENTFFRALKGIIDPEEKRKIIGETFIRVFEEEALRRFAPQSKPIFLIQGTIYPDVIESKGSQHADKIKTHHNVGGIPSKHKFTIVEPLRMFYKDEVREIARKLKFPPVIIHRHVFPGPGLSVRIIGEVTKEKLAILKKADKIVVEEIKKSGLYDDIWMAFAVLTGVKSTGVTGDERKYGETIALRAISSKDTMTADWVRLPYNVLAKISERIVTEVFEVVRVVYDITTKPPATMEWE